MSASSTASVTMECTSARARLGSLFFTKERMRWMICPARWAWWAVFCRAVSRASSVSCPLWMRDTMPLQ
ncbi:hypothetical protein D3C72_2186320 [compost metagenome]